MPIVCEHLHLGTYFEIAEIAGLRGTTSKFLGEFANIFYSQKWAKKCNLLALLNSSETHKINCGNRLHFFCFLPGKPFKQRRDFGDHCLKNRRKQRDI